MGVAVGWKDGGDIALFIFLGQRVRRCQRTLHALGPGFRVAEHLPNPLAARKIVTAGTGHDARDTGGGLQELTASEPVTCHGGLL